MDTLSVPHQKPNLSIGIALSAMIHGTIVLLFVIATQKEAAIKSEQPPITAYFYQKVAQLTAKSIAKPMTKQKQSPLQSIKNTASSIDESRSTPATPSIAKDPLAKRQQTKTDHKNPSTVQPRANTTINTAAILQHLASQKYSDAQKSSAKDSYQSYQQQKNYIPPSKTKFNQLPEAKAKEVRVNCDNNFVVGLIRHR